MGCALNEMSFAAECVKPGCEWKREAKRVERYALVSAMAQHSEATGHAFFAHMEIRLSVMYYDEDSRSIQSKG